MGERSTHASPSSTSASSSPPARAKSSSSISSADIVELNGKKFCCRFLACCSDSSGDNGGSLRMSGGDLGALKGGKEVGRGTWEVQRLGKRSLSSDHAASSEWITGCVQ